MGVTVPRSLALDSVSSGSRTFTFRNPLEVEVACDEGVWALTHHESGLNSYGETLEEALGSFANDVAYAWDAYVARADSDLGKLALRTKRVLSVLVQEVS